MPKLRHRLVQRLAFVWSDVSDEIRRRTALLNARWALLEARWAMLTLKWSFGKWNARWWKLKYTLRQVTVFGWIFFAVAIPAAVWGTGQILDFIWTAATLTTVPGDRLTVEQKAQLILFMFGLAVAATVLKRKKQMLYGYLEIIVGLYAGWRVLDRLTQDTVQNVFLLAGGVYVIGRGIQNFREGYERDVLPGVKQMIEERERNERERAAKAFKAAAERAKQMRESELGV